MSDLFQPRNTGGFESLFARKKKPVARPPSLTAPPPVAPPLSTASPSAIAPPPSQPATVAPASVQPAAAPAAPPPLDFSGAAGEGNVLQLIASRYPVASLSFNSVPYAEMSSEDLRGLMAWARQRSGSNPELNDVASRANDALLSRGESAIAPAAPSAPAAPPPATPEDVAEERAGEAEARIREQLQPILDELAQLQIPEFGGIQEELTGIRGLMDRLEQGLTPQEQRQATEEAARGAGFFSLDDQGNVVVSPEDLQRYADAVGRFHTPAPTTESVTRTPEQERNLRAARRADIAAATEMTNNIFGDTGSFARVLTASQRFTQEISDRALARELDVDAQNFANALASFEAENDRLQFAIQQGNISRQDFLNRRENQIGQLLQTHFATAQLRMQEFSTQTDAVLAHADLLYKSVHTTLAVEEGALAVWTETFNKEMAPEIARLTREAQEAELRAAQTAGEPGLFDWLTIAVDIVGIIATIVTGGAAAPAAGAASVLMRGTRAVGGF